MLNIGLSDGLQLKLPSRKTKIPGSNSRYSKYGRECTTCRKFQRWENFTKHKIGFNGKRNDCKKCCCERDKQWREANRESRLEYYKQWYLENRESRSEYNKQWYLENRDARLENCRQWREANRDAISEYNAEYFRSPKGRLVSRRSSHRRRTRMKAIINEPYSLSEFYTKFAYVNVLLFGDRDHKISKCPYCKKELKLNDATLDHFVPISRNGNNTLANIILCCGSCNRTKRDKIPHIFLRNTKLTLGEQSVIKSCARETWVTDSLQYVELLNEIVEDLEDGLY